LTILKQQQQELIQWKNWLGKNEGKIPLRVDDKELVENMKAKLEAALKNKEKARSVEEKVAAAGAVDACRSESKSDQKRRQLDKHKYSCAPSASSLEGRIEKWGQDIRKLEVDIRNRDENKEVALGTSKINYMDPRISVAWCKRCEVPIDKIFAKTLRDKFNWAMAVPPSWKFE
jgi:DNA topoisomerase-1